MWTPRRVHCPSLQGSECLRPSCPGSRAAARAPPASPFPLCYGNTTLENRGGCEAGDDTQRQPRAAGTLQDLSQGSREGVREAAGSDPPYRRLQGVKSSSQQPPPRWHRALAFIRSTCHAKNEPSWKSQPPSNCSSFPSHSISSSYRSQTHFLPAFKSHSHFSQSKVPEPWVQGRWCEREADP